MWNKLCRQTGNWGGTVLCYSQKVTRCAASSDHGVTHVHLGQDKGEPRQVANTNCLYSKLHFTNRKTFTFLTNSSKYHFPTLTE